MNQSPSNANKANKDRRKQQLTWPNRNQIPTTQSIGQLDSRQTIAPFGQPPGSVRALQPVVQPPAQPNFPPLVNMSPYAMPLMQLPAAQPMMPLSPGMIHPMMLSPQSQPNRPNDVPVDLFEKDRLPLDRRSGQPMMVADPPCEITMTTCKKPKCLLVKTKFCADVFRYAMLDQSAENSMVREAIDELLEEGKTVLSKCNAQPSSEPPLVSKVSLPFLKSIHIVELPADNVFRAQDYLYYCSLCDYHISSIAHVRTHMENSAHMDQNSKDVDRAALTSAMPSPLEMQLKALNGSLDRDVVVDDPNSWLEDERKKIQDDIQTFRSIVCESLQVTEGSVDLRLYGSYATGTAVEGSNVNLSLSVDDVECANAICALRDIVERLRTKQNTLHEQTDAVLKIVDGMPQVVFSLNKRNFCVLWEDFERVDLCVLLKTYYDLNSDALSLVRIVRHWAKVSGIDDSDVLRPGLTKYAFDLMVIHFMQKRGLLPVLHEMIDVEEENTSEAGNKLAKGNAYLKDLDAIKQKWSIERERTSFATLFLQFLAFYVNERQVVQIVSSSSVSKDDTKWHKKIFQIADPFRRDNVVNFTKAFQPFFFNTFLASYVYLAIPRDCSGPTTDVQLQQKMVESPRKKKSNNNKTPSRSNGALKTNTPSTPAEETKQSRPNAVRRLPSNNETPRRKVSEPDVEMTPQSLKGKGNMEKDQQITPRKATTALTLSVDKDSGGISIANISVSTISDLTLKQNKEEKKDDMKDKELFGTFLQELADWHGPAVIVGITDSRLSRLAERKLVLPTGYQFLWPYDDCDCAFLVGPHVVPFVRNLKRVSSHALQLELGLPNIASIVRIIQCVPHADLFGLDNHLDSSSDDSMLPIIMKFVKGEVGYCENEDVTGRYTKEKSLEEGETLIDWCCKRKLAVWNTFFSTFNTFQSKKEGSDVILSAMRASMNDSLRIKTVKYFTRELSTANAIEVSCRLHMKPGCKLPCEVSMTKEQLQKSATKSSEDSVFNAVVVDAVIAKTGTKTEMKTPECEKSASKKKGKSKRNHDKKVEKRMAILEQNAAKEQNVAESECSVDVSVDISTSEVDSRVRISSSEVDEYCDDNDLPLFMKKPVGNVELDGVNVYSRRTMLAIRFGDNNQENPQIRKRCEAYRIRIVKDEETMDMSSLKGQLYSIADSSPKPSRKETKRNSKSGSSKVIDGVAVTSIGGAGDVESPVAAVETPASREHDDEIPTTSYEGGNNGVVEDVLDQEGVPTENGKICFEEFYIFYNEKSLCAGFNKAKDWPVEKYSYSFTDRDNFTLGFRAEFKCTYCSNADHTTAGCPEMQVPVYTPIARDISDVELEELSKLVQFNWNRSRVSDRAREQMNNFVSRLEDILRTHFDRQDIRLSIFGSIGNGFGSRVSDVDICFRFETDEPPPDLEDVAVVLRIGKALGSLQHIMRPFHVQTITTAKVPIVKFTLGQYEGDISYYNVLALSNTILMNTYCQWDKERVPALGMFIKKWAKGCQIGDASQGSLSSYAYIIMMIHYLQNCEVPVLPRLQEDFRPEPYVPSMVGPCDVYFHKDVIPNWSKNTQTTGELFLGFLDFYAKFEFDTQVIQIRQRRELTKMEKTWRKHLCIEDPFDLTHNLGSGISHKMFVFIVRSIDHSRTLFNRPNAREEFCAGQLLEYTKHKMLDKNHFEKYLNYALDECCIGMPPSDRVCKRCHKIGHFVENCPNKIWDKQRAQHRRQQQQQQQQQQTAGRFGEYQQGNNYRQGNRPGFGFRGNRTYNRGGSNEKNDRGPAWW